MKKMKSACPASDIINILSRKWTLLILRELNNDNKKRFNELVKQLSNISPRTLSKRLKELEKISLIEKERFNEIPPRVEYSLTAAGKDMVKCFRYLDKWAEKWGINRNMAHS
jgi:DNA-binding HxlR family transcriptional regulator